MNRLKKMVLKALSSPKINMKEDYLWIRKIQRMISAKPKKYLILDRKIYSEDSSHDIPVRIFCPKKREHGDALLFFHGGGWVIGDIDTYTHVCVNMAELTGRVVYSVDYRLAPEHPYPSGLDDCCRAAEVLLAHNSKLTLIGDSAGANLAAAVSLRLRDKGRIVPEKQILIYPITYWDHSESSPFGSIRTNGYDYGLTSKKVREYMELYQPDSNLRRSKYISPLMAGDLAGQPDTLVITAEFDPLRDEGEAYGEALSKAGNRVKIHRVNGAAHGFIVYPKFAKSVKEAYSEINGFLNQ